MSSFNAVQALGCKYVLIIQPDVCTDMTVPVLAGQQGVLPQLSESDLSGSREVGNSRWRESSDFENGVNPPLSAGVLLGAGSEQTHKQGAKQ